MVSLLMNAKLSADATRSWSYEIIYVFPLVAIRMRDTLLEPEVGLT